MKIELTVRPLLMPRFYLLLQQGIMVKVQVNCSIQSLLCDQLDINRSYLDERIQTIFLDGRPVDDINGALVKDRSTLALSAAMPGLVGAVLRRGGYYAPMRREISYEEKKQGLTLQEGTVIIKLFNLLTEELGPSFLLRGIWTNGKDVKDIIKGGADESWSGWLEARIDEKIIDLEELRKMTWPDGEIFLRVRTEV
ncbi:MAG: hypothetical protein V1930_03720 [Pseudomonadota bacterium]